MLFLGLINKDRGIARLWVSTGFDEHNDWLGSFSHKLWSGLKNKNVDEMRILDVSVSLFRARFSIDLQRPIEKSVFKLI